jgi:hypothetical protein
MCDRTSFQAPATQETFLLLAFGRTALHRIRMIVFTRDRVLPRCRLLGEPRRRAVGWKAGSGTRSFIRIRSRLTAVGPSPDEEVTLTAITA